MLDKVTISNLQIHGYHGVKDAEKALGQKFYIDLTCSVDRSNTAADTMANTVCYGELCQLVENVSSAETFNLIESLAERIAISVFNAHHLVKQVEITIRKPNAPISHHVDHVGVSIVRHRNA